MVAGPALDRARGDAHVLRVALLPCGRAPQRRLNLAPPPPPWSTSYRGSRMRAGFPRLSGGRSRLGVAMAVRESVSPNGAGTRRAWFVAACLVVLFVAALFLRAYWNLDAANPAD